MSPPSDQRKLHGSSYVEHFERSQSPARLARLLRYIDLENAPVVADFACGNGMLLELVAPPVSAYVGVDFSEPFIESANDRKRRLGVDNASFCCSSIEDFCRENKGRFDRDRRTVAGTVDHQSYVSLKILFSSECPTK